MSNAKVEPEAGVVVEDHGRGQDLGQGAPGDRRAHLVGDQLGDALHVVADGLGHLGQHRGPLGRRHAGPGTVVEGLAGRRPRPGRRRRPWPRGPGRRPPRWSGETTSNAEEDEGSTHSPPMNRRSYDFMGPPRLRTGSTPVGRSYPLMAGRTAAVRLTDRSPGAALTPAVAVEPDTLPGTHHRAVRSVHRPSSTGSTRSSRALPSR